MAGEALTPTTYIQHHLKNLTAQVGGEGPFWTINVDTFVTAVLMGLLLMFCQTESVIERQRGITWFLAWTLLILGSMAVTASGQCPDEPDEHDQRRPLRS